jgi:RimJ/RimL family protein N-acetyltransferase
MIVVRPATPADAPAMGRIHVDSWRWAYAGLVDGEFLSQLDADQRRETWEQRLGSPSTEGPYTVVAELDGEVVAMCTVGPYRDRRRRDPGVELWMLNAHPTAMGTGAATALHAEAVAWMTASGRRTAALWVVEGNSRARRFYEREGWRADGVRREQRIGASDVPLVRYVRDLVSPGHR